MKKRIIAILLCVSITFSSFGLHKKAEAAVTGTVVAIATIGTFAFSVFMLITSGEAERIADDVYYWIEYTAKPGFENCFIGDGSHLAVGYNQIFQTVNGWFESGELQVVDGQIVLTYSQYQELYNQAFNVMAKPDVSFNADYDCYFIESAIPNGFSLESLPVVDLFVKSPAGQSYAVIYYDDNRIVFSDWFLSLQSDISVHTSFSPYQVKSNFSQSTLSGGLSATNSLMSYYSSFKYIINIASLNKFQLQYFFMNSNQSASNTTSNCFVYENGILSYTSASSVDLSGMKTGIITTTGDYGSFLKSVTGYNQSLVPPDGLDDLSGTLPTDYNPTLTFPSVPDNRPIVNQIIIGNVPGFADLPLSDYQAELDTDIDIPSVIINKFPFCIPFDFIRIIGVLCADPVAPVFRIPISTSPENLEGWEGNQTIDEYLNPDELLFEIDEEVIIDLSVIPLLQPICYTCFIVGFVLLLIHITPKMIQH